MLRIFGLVVFMLLSNSLYAFDDSLNCGWVRFFGITATTDGVGQYSDNKVFITLYNDITNGGSHVSGSSMTCYDAFYNNKHVYMRYGYIDVSQPGYDSMLATLLRAQKLLGQGKVYLMLVIDAYSQTRVVYPDGKKEGLPGSAYRIEGINIQLPGP